MDPSIEHFGLINTANRPDEGASSRAETPDRRPCQKKYFHVEREMKRRREKGENREIQDKSTLGNRRDHVPSAKENTVKNCFSPRRF
jgi:hypothetical protein